MVVHGFQLGLGNLRGLQMVGFITGVVVCATGIVLFERGLRRRAHAALVAKLLPRYSAQRRMWTAAGRAEVLRAHPDSFLMDESDWVDGSSAHGRGDASGAKLHEATRALLVSLEDELRRETSCDRRPSRPACRRARLRAVRRLEPRRRRVSARPQPIVS